MIITNSQAAALGRLSIYAMDMLNAGNRSASTPPKVQPPTNPLTNALTPPVDPRIAAEGYELVAYIAAHDAMLDGNKFVVPGAEAYYGFVAKAATPQGPERFVVVIRGTQGILEWIEDAEFCPTPHPRVPGGTVEQGFWGIYSTMRLLDLDGEELGPNFLMGLKAVIGRNQATVIGHSLGSALATYLTYDLAVSNCNVRACLFASPQTGNDVFVQAFDKAVPEYRLFNYVLDLVPRAPMELGYETLARVTVLQPATAEASIRFSVFCNHHVVCYCAMLDYEATMNDPAVLVTADDKACRACVLGPETARPSMAKALADLANLRL